MLFCRLLIFFKINFFHKILSGIPSQCPDQVQRFVGPDLGPTVCKGHQQTTLGGKELNSITHLTYLQSNLLKHIKYNRDMHFFPYITSTKSTQPLITLVSIQDVGSHHVDKQPLLSLQASTSAARIHIVWQR